MGVREIVGVIVVGVMASVAAAPQSDITLTKNGYIGVTVAIGDLDESKCEQYVNNIKAMVEAASRLMFNATEEKVFFGDVVIVVPENWSYQGIQLESMSHIYSWDSAHLRLGPSHYLFGDNPWTQQLGGCGEPGDWIYLSENFLMNHSNVGSPGTVLVHEWAKYRWGVFEEYGHAHDLIFPAAHHDANNTVTPTYCTNNPLEGTMYCPDEGSEEECQFTPELTQNNTVTSSLLAAPFLDTVTNFCDAGSHKAEVPTKHNLLCNQNSVKDVMARHSDMKGNLVNFLDTKFTVFQAAADWPRMVLLIDYSTVMGVSGQVRGRWEQLRDNVLQFIKVEAAANSYLGVVVFGNITIASPLLALNLVNNRESIAALIPVDAPGPGNKYLQAAITSGTKVLGDQGGTLVLLTENLNEYPPSPDLVKAAANNPVWPILYPCNIQVSTEAYQQLADISPDTSVLTVQNTKFSLNGIDYQSVNTSAELHYDLLTATASIASRVVLGSCNESDCTITLNMMDSTMYISQAYVKVFCSAAEDMTYTKIAVTSPNADNLNGILENTKISFQISSLQTGQYLVSVTGSSLYVTVMAELWATPTPPDLQVSVWSPKGLQDLFYSPGRAPRLLAKITNSASWPVLFADVTAKVAIKIKPEKPINITLNDAGIGGDVTGQDGIYSGYLVGFEPNNDGTVTDVTITVNVTDNDGKARVAKPSLRAAPITTGIVKCCGSQLDVSNLQLEDPGSFVIASSGVSGRLTGESPGILHPGQVTDLRASRTGKEVTLVFTAPGARLDQGQADRYEINSHNAGEELLIRNITGRPVGLLVEEQVTLLECDKVYTFTVVAYYNGTSGSSSNSVREGVSCRILEGLSGGAIAGIIIGCILVVLLIILIIYLCLNRDHLDDLWVWKILTCRGSPCCKKNKDDELYKQPSQARRSDVIRNNTSPSRPVRDLTDLLSSPRAVVTRTARQNKTQDKDDGGFIEHHRQRDNRQMRAAEDGESLASSRSTLPINKVGLPIAGDNHGYDDGPYAIYKNVGPVSRYPKINTQV